MDGGPDAVTREDLIGRARTPRPGIAARAAEAPTGSGACPMRPGPGLWRLLRRDCEEIHARAEAGEVPSLEERHRWRRNDGYAGKLLIQAVDRPMALSGATGNAEGSPLQRRCNAIATPRQRRCNAIGATSTRWPPASRWPGTPRARITAASRSACRAEPA